MKRKKIAEDKASSYKISELIFNAAKDELKKANQWNSKSFIEKIIQQASTYKLAELLFNAGKIEKSEAKRITEEKVSRGKLAKYLLEHAGLKGNVDTAKTIVKSIVNHFF